jgi:allophanate hydrolase
MAAPRTLSIAELFAGYRERRFAPAQIIEGVLDAIARAPERQVWISLLPRERVLEMARSLEGQAPESLPLYGVPFAVKDNIDVAGIATTAGCPAFAYAPSTSALVVQRLIDAGAVPIGKTNLDQFATGLVGTRSPYGACLNSFNDAYVSGGSSSGSAVAVASGLVSFSLGTDTAGSGRVPAAFNNLIGLKPTNGRLSTRGVVPACRSLDCVSVFALTAEDAARVLAVAEGYDAEDPYSRVTTDVPLTSSVPHRRGVDGAHRLSGIIGGEPIQFRFGVPRADQLEFFGDAGYAQLFMEARERLVSLGGLPVEIDFAPFRAIARLLYEGPWIAERYAAVGEFIERHADAVDPVVRQLILAGSRISAAEGFKGLHQFQALQRTAEATWLDVDVMLTPTTGTVYRIAQIEADPIRLNANLGFYTNFVNFLGLAAVAVPAGFRRDGLPFGVTLVGRSWSDFDLLALAARLQRAGVDRAGALKIGLPADMGALPFDRDAATSRTAGSSSALFLRSASETPARIPIAVCGAHMTGLPLNSQLTERGAQFLERTRTAATYRFYALPGGPPFRPGLVRVATGGSAIEVEVWSIPAEHFGSLVAGIPAPLGVGKVELVNGTHIPGFLCESHAVTQAEDITHLASWLTYLASRG